ncbi:MAG: DUF6438 domain-containing protein [Bacteroidota bacterium]|nr:DUF6438 domain-containing protein [Bacteroidota bacterium]
MKVVYFLSFVLILVSSFACHKRTKNLANQKGNKKNIPNALPIFKPTLQSSDTLAIQADTLLFYHRGPCFGYCANYEFLIYTNGVVQYKGHNNIEPSGTHYSLLTDDNWRDIKQAYQKADFFNLADVYPIEKEMYIPDLPTTTLIIYDSGKKKRIRDNHSTPPALKSFEIYLDSFLRGLELDNFKN